MTKQEELYKVVEDFIKEQEISCAETIYQCDRVILAASEFMEKCCDIVGYMEFEEE